MTQAIATASPPSAAPLPTPGSVGAWVMAARPATLTVGVVPVVVGTAVAHVSHVGTGARVGPALAALLGSVMLQLTSNFANDVFDHEKGADTAERLGPTRAVQSGVLTAKQVRAGMYTTIAIATLAGVYLTAVAGWPVVAIGIASILSAIAYTGGPYPLGYHGLGDLFVFLFFGLVAVCGTVFVETGTVPLLAWIAAIPVGAIATGLLIVNNIRDRETDVKAGKRTLAVRFGRAASIGEYVTLLVAAYLTPLAVVLGLGHRPWVLLPWLTIPVAVSLARAVATTNGRALNPYLGKTAKLLLAFGVLFAIGLVAAG